MQRSQQLDAEKAKAAEDIAKKAAKKAQVAAEKERENKRICLEYERKEHAKQRGTVTSITTPPKGKKTSNYVSGKPLLQKGDTVRVSSDYSPYKNSPGGDGIVTDVKGSGGKLTVDVLQHDAIAAQKFEHDVPLFRLTRIRSATSSASIIHSPPQLVQLSKGLAKMH